MSLKQFVEEIVNCRKCRLWKNAENAVPGEGPDDATIMLVGQNPGEQEDQTGKPFVGRSGKFLDKILKENKIERKNLFITNIVKHKTPENRKPKDDEVEACMPYLLQQIEIIKPKIIILMGNIASQIPKKFKAKYIETYHPSAAMRFPKWKEKFEKDIKSLRNLIEDN